MYITEEQKKVLEETFGKKAPQLISHLTNKKGKSVLFKDDNTLMHSKEETEKRIMKTSTTKKVNLPIVVETHVEPILETLSRLVTEKDEWNFSSIEENEKALEKVKELKTIIEGKKQESIDESIKALEKIIEDATEKLKKLKGEDQSKPTTEAEQKEGEAEASEKKEEETEEAK